jgi:predicted permease
MSLFSRLVNLFRTDRMDRDIDDELRFHLEARINDLMSLGMPRGEAEREARHRLGQPLALRERSRDVRFLPRIDALRSDIRFGVRMLAKHPVVTAAALVSLALAMGSSLAAFSLIDALILRPLPVRTPSELVYLTYQQPDATTSSETADERDSFSYPAFLHLRQQARGKASLFAVSYSGPAGRAVIDPSAGQEPLRVQWISGDAFGILGIRPALGRLLTASDDAKRGEGAVAVLSHRFWMRRFGGAASVLGRTIRIEDAQNRTFEIVGVAQEGLSSLEPGNPTDVWLPITMGDPNALDSKGWQWFRTWGRLAPGVSAAQLQPPLQAAFSSFRRDFAREFAGQAPPDLIKRYVNSPLDVRSASNGPSSVRKDFGRPLWILAAMVGLVLLIACTNVANLFIARAAAREREMALRVSIGAGRGRLVQQLLVEAGLLAAGACLLGIAFARVAAPAIVSRLTPATNPTWLDLRFDWRALTFSAAVCAAATVLCGIAPALRASTVAPQDALKTGGGRHTGDFGLLRPLVAAQLGFSFVVLFLSALLLTSFHRLSNVDLGFVPEGLALLRLQAKELNGEEKLAQSRATMRQLLDEVRHQPGVTAASLSSWALMHGNGWSALVRMPGRATDSLEIYYLGVSPGFFDTMRIRRLAGRELRAGDSKPERQAVVVNESFARRFYGSVMPVGQRFDRLEGGGKTMSQEIVGVVADAKYRDLREPAPPTVYVPLDQVDGATLEVRTQGQPLALASMLRGAISRVHPSLEVRSVELQSTVVENTMIRERLLALLSAFFGLVALALAGVGLYGVLSYGVVRRTREIGIRVALGARRPRIVRLIVSDIALAGAIGLAAGLASGLALARLVATLLFEVTPADASSLAIAVAALLGVGIAAAVPPALRAARVDPIVALRYE